MSNAPREPQPPSQPRPQQDPASGPKKAGTQRETALAKLTRLAADFFGDTTREAVVREKVQENRELLEALNAFKLKRRATILSMLGTTILAIHVEITLHEWIESNPGEPIPMGPDYTFWANGAGMLLMIAAWENPKPPMRRLRTVAWTLIATAAAIGIQYLAWGY